VVEQSSTVHGGDIEQNLRVDMSDYTPDRWVVIHILPHVENNHPNALAHYRVFTTCYGNYATGDTWRMNSGIVRAEEDDLFYHFYGSSGSVYHCRKTSYGFSNYGYSVFSGMVKESIGFDMVVEKEDTNFMALEYNL
jgi:hypothetical protein